jgi:DNA repair protein RadC
MGSRKTTGATGVRGWPEGERPRERLAKYGAEALSEAQLLAIILRTGTRGRTVLDLARELLDKFGSLRALDRASQTDLRTVGGIGTAKIAQIKAALELGKRMMAESSAGKPLFASSEAVYLHFAGRFKNHRKETIVAALLDAKNRLMKECRVSEGTLTNTAIHPREAFGDAMRESAASVIFVHNHPSGDPEPSRDDLAVTERLKTTGDIVGIRVLDHVIIGDGRYVSLKERGFL